MTLCQRAFAGAIAFRAARRGNVSIIFAFSLIPLVGLVGLGIDYGIGLSNKAKLDHAADAAAVAAVATAKAYVAANPTDPKLAQDAITAGLTQAKNSFAVNAGSVIFASVPAPTLTLTRTGQTFSSSVSYSARTTNHFGQIFGQPSLNVSGSVKASSDVPKYLDFYLLVDVSGSMGLPTSPEGQAALANINFESISAQGCQFACHFPNTNGWNNATRNNIELRTTSVNSAVCSLIQQATGSNLYRVGIYPFINQMATLVGLASTTDTSGLSTAAQCGSQTPMAFTNLLDIGSTQLATNGDPSTGTGSGGTHFEVVFPQMASTIASFGDGSSALKPKPYVFLITDGMENNQHYASAMGGKYVYPGAPSLFPGYPDAWWDGSQPSAIDPSQCAALKSAGVTISILYIPYIQISFVNDGSNVAWENATVNGISPGLQTPLQQCASPGFFYTANSSADITAALNAMFAQATQITHLTQ